MREAGAALAAVKCSADGLAYDLARAAAAVTDLCSVSVTFRARTAGRYGETSLDRKDKDVDGGVDGGVDAVLCKEVSGQQQLGHRRHRRGGRRHRIADGPTSCPSTPQLPGELYAVANR